MLRVTAVIGRATDPVFAERVHQLEHHGSVETVRLSRADMARRRQQVRTDRGTELALMLDRDAQLENGSILLLEKNRAVLIALDEPSWLVLRASNVARALEVGYFAGNMHWKVRFDGEALCIALDGPRTDYLQRMHHLLHSGDVIVEPEAAGGTSISESSSSVQRTSHHDPQHSH